MSFALAVLMLFVGATLMWVAAHGTGATSPWTLYQQILGGLAGTYTSANAAGPSAASASGTAAGTGAQAAAGAVADDTESDDSSDDEGDD